MSVQKDWAWCPECQAMHFAGGRFPQDRAAHDPARSFTPTTVGRVSEHYGGYMSCRDF